ncbi:cytoplasmic protein NCK1 [Triplophysa dalaica]|uniref:cytoplasmic protein NCK1 n=1 Tax=Triplophysa dalaica TaxID=1582913 RepID=UPI0024DF8817|nr:cytoplasmic protein NCK1 [Triplophysa dalaica]
MDMANLFKHFFRIGKAKQKSCMKDLPSTADKYTDNNERLYDLNLPALVKFNYTAKREDELSLVKGTKVIVMEKCSDGWWRGTYKGLSGWFPSNYVTEDVHGTMGGGTYKEKLHNDNGTLVLQTVQALYRFSSGNDEELSFNKDELMDVLEKPENDPEWWKCRKQNGQVGLLPKNYVTVVQTSNNELEMSGPPTSNYDYIRPCINGKFGGQLWYFGKVTRHQAEMVLNQRGVDGDFLIRDSESMPNDFSITLKAMYKNKHFKVQQKDGLYCIGQRRFSSMEKLVEHYKKAPIFTSEQGDKLFLIKALS